MVRNETASRLTDQHIRHSVVYNGQIKQNVLCLVGCSYFILIMNNLRRCQLAVLELTYFVCSQGAATITWIFFPSAEETINTVIFCHTDKSRLHNSERLSVYFYSCTLKMTKNYHAF